MPLGCGSNAHWQQAKSVISTTATAVILTRVTFLKYLFALKDSKICLKDLI